MLRSSLFKAKKSVLEVRKTFSWHNKTSFQDETTCMYSNCDESLPR